MSSSEEATRFSSASASLQAHLSLSWLFCFPSYKIGCRRTGLFCPLITPQHRESWAGSGHSELAGYVTQWVQVFNQNVPVYQGARKEEPTALRMWTTFCEPRSSCSSLSSLTSGRLPIASMLSHHNQTWRELKGMVPGKSEFRVYFLTHGGEGTIFLLLFKFILLKYSWFTMVC